MNTNWKRNFLTIWSGQAASLLTSAVLQMALIWHLTATTKSALVLSAASFMGFLPAALLGGIAGTLVDRWNRKLVMIGADLFIALVSVILAVYALFAELPVWLVLTVLFVRSIGTAFHTPAISAVTPLIVPEEKLTKCSGITQSLQTVGYIAGAAIAGVLYPVWSISGLVFLDVAGAVAASAAVAVVGIPSPPKEEHPAGRSNLLSEMKAGYRILHRSRGLFALLWIGAAFMVLFSPINALFPLMSLDYFGGTTAQAAIAEITFAAGMFAGGLLLGVWGGFKNRATSMIGALMMMGTAIALSGLLPTNGFPAFAILSLLMGFSSPFYNGPQTALMQEKIAPEYLGRVFGLYGSIVSLAMPLGLVLSGIFADSIGVHHWFLLSGAGCILLAVLAMTLPSIRGIEKEQPQRET